MNKEPQFSWDEETGIAICLLTDGYNIFKGMAFCDQEDQDMKSEKTGCQIALWRAEIEYYKHVRDNEIKPALKALKHIHSVMQFNPKFNRKSYENKILWKEIQSKELDLTVINKLLAQKKLELKEYLKEKQDFYNRIRQYRNNKVGQN